MLLYFLPGAEGPSIDPEAHGLSHAFEGAPTVMPQEGEGVKGVLACQRSSGEGLGYHPDRQEWRTAPGGAYRFGWAQDAPPGPSELMRANPQHGRLVMMADERPWLVPQLRVYSDERLGMTCCLPFKGALTEGGEWTQGEVMPAYRRLDELAERLLDGMVRAEDHTLPAEVRPEKMQTAELLDVVAELLAVNYRVSRVELAALGVLSTDRLVEAARYACDLDTAEASIERRLKKKRAPSGSSRSVSGAGALSPATA